MKILSILSIFLLVLMPVAFAAGGTHNPSEIGAGNFVDGVFGFPGTLGVQGLFISVGSAIFRAGVTITNGDLDVQSGDITASGEIISAGDIQTTGGTICDGSGNCLDTVSGGGGPDDDWSIIGGVLTSDATANSILANDDTTVAGELTVTGDAVVQTDLTVEGIAYGNNGVLWSDANDGANSGMDADLLDGKENGELDCNYINNYEVEIVDDGWGGANPEFCVKSGQCQLNTAAQCFPRDSNTAKHSCSSDADCQSYCQGIAPSSRTCDWNCNGNYLICPGGTHIWGSTACTTLTGYFCLDDTEFPPVGACVCSWDAAPRIYNKASVSEEWFCTTMNP